MINCKVVYIKMNKRLKHIPRYQGGGTVVVAGRLGMNAWSWGWGGGSGGGGCGRW